MFVEERYPCFNMLSNPEERAENGIGMNLPASLVDQP